LKPYSRLRSIVLSLKEAQPAAEGAAPHLINYTEKLASALRQQLRKFFGDRLQKTMDSLKWPTRELNITDKLLAQWTQDVELLIDLQMPYVDCRGFFVPCECILTMPSGNCNRVMCWTLLMVLNRRFCSHWK
jgi:hypothetical protein